ASHFLTFGQGRACASRRVEGGYAGAPGANALRQRPLWYQLQFDLPGAEELLEDRGAGRARIAADDLADPSRGDQGSQPHPTVASIVVHDSQVARALIDKGMDQFDR